MKRSFIFLVFSMLLGLLSFSGCQAGELITPGRYSLSDSYTIVLDFLPDGRYYFNDHEYSVVSSGTYTIKNNQISLVETIGSCDATPGVFSVSQANRVIRFKEIKDVCSNRNLLLTKLPFIRLRQQNPYLSISKEIFIKDFNVNYAAVDSDGNIYISDGLAAISKYDSDGNFIFSWGGVAHPNGLLVDPENNILVANYDGPDIRKFDPSGMLLLKWKVDSNLLGPADIGLDSKGDVYVLLKGEQDHYVEKFTSDGILIASWAGQGKNNGQVYGTFNYSPTQIGVDANGNNYVTDPNNDRVVKFDLNGVFKYNLTGDADRQLAEPKYLDVDSAGMVYVLDNSQTLWQFDSNGKTVGKWFSPYWGAVSLGVDGSILVADWKVIARVHLP